MTSHRVGVVKPLWPGWGCSKEKTRPLIFSTSLGPFLHYKSTVHLPLASRGFASHVFLVNILQNNCWGNKDERTLNIFKFLNYYQKLKLTVWPRGGASSEAWIRVYMIAPVKKFGRARLNTDFLINKHGGDFMWKRVCADSQTIWLFDVQTSQEGFGRFFTRRLVIKRDHGCKFCSKKRKYCNQRLADPGENHSTVNSLKETTDFS